MRALTSNRRSLPQGNREPAAPRSFGIATLLTAVLLGGCTVGPDFMRPKMDLPPQFTERAATPTEIAVTQAQLSHWWQSFDDPVLNSLEAQILTGNIDLQVAAERLVQARAQRDQVAAGALPTVDFVGSAEQARASTTVTYPPGFGDYGAFLYGFDASWELDIFGENRRMTEAADNQIRRTLASRRALLVSLTSELASDYASLRAAQYRLSIAESNVNIAYQVVNLTQTELAQGVGTDLEMLQARSQLESTKATLPALRAQVAVMAHAIGVLLGRYPGALEAQLSQPMPLMSPPATLPATIPAEVIANRPDVHEAEFQYAAANAEIGVAVAERLPHISIPLTLTPQASALNTLFEAASLTYSAALSGVQHVYAGGRYRARERAARASAEVARLDYRTAVLKALQEVEDALVRLQSDQQSEAALRASLRDAKTALDHASRLYNAGLTDFITLLTDERTVFASRDALANSQVAVLQDTIALFKALGGGWQKIDLDVLPPAPGAVAGSR
jgi:NodT family efflux transporter outer membrane factor (OMF) lipoprotein